MDEESGEEEWGEGEGEAGKLGALASTSDILPLPPIPYRGADFLYPRTRVVADLWLRARVRSGWWCACVRACVRGCGCCGGGVYVCV